MPICHRYDFSNKIYISSDKVLPLLPPDSVLVIDKASYHNRITGMGLF